MKLVDGDIPGLIAVLIFYLLLFLVLSRVSFFPLWAKVLIAVIFTIWLLKKMEIIFCAN